MPTDQPGGLNSQEAWELWVRTLLQILLEGTQSARCDIKPYNKNNIMNYPSLPKQHSDRKPYVAIQDHEWIGETASENQPDKIKIESSLEPQPQPSLQESPLSKFYTDRSRASEIQSKEAESRLTTRQEAKKSPTQLMQDLLRNLVDDPITAVNPYYSKQSEHKLAELLTNKGKLINYIQQLEEKIPQKSAKVGKNYEMLIILLQQVQANNVQIRQQNGGFEMAFNSDDLKRNSAQISSLKQTIEKKENELKEIIDSYQSIVQEFNSVITRITHQTPSIAKQPPSL